MIRIESDKLINGTEVTLNFTETQLANAVAAMNQKQLHDFMRDLNTNAPELLQMIQYDESGQPNNLDNLSSLVIERLTRLSEGYISYTPDPVAEQKLEILANYAESLDNKELETQLRDVGLLQHSSNLMR